MAFQVCELEKYTNCTLILMPLKLNFTIHIRDTFLDTFLFSIGALCCKLFFYTNVFHSVLDLSYFLNKKTSMVAMQQEILCSRVFKGISVTVIETQETGCRAH